MTIINVKNKGIDEATSNINSLYDAAMRKLQNGYSNEEVKTFTPKSGIIEKFTTARLSALDGTADSARDLLGLAALSAKDKEMIAILAKSVVDADLIYQVKKMEAASDKFKIYSAHIEVARDDHIEQLVEGQDNRHIIDSLEQTYAALGA